MNDYYPWVNDANSFVQVKSGTIFDNFLICDDVKEAEEFGKETWGVTKVMKIIIMLIIVIIILMILNAE